MFGRESTANLHALLIHLDAGAIKDVAGKNFVQCFLQIPPANLLSKGIMYAATELVHQNDLKLKQYGHQCKQSSDHYVRSNEQPRNYIKSAFTDQSW